MNLIDEILTKFSQETGIDSVIGLRLLDSFLARLNADLDQIEQTLYSGDAALAARQIHSLKGTSANLRMTQLADQALNLERMVRENRLAEALTFMPQLRETTGKIFAARQAQQG